MLRKRYVMRGGKQDNADRSLARRDRERPDVTEVGRACHGPGALLLWSRLEQVARSKCLPERPLLSIDLLLPEGPDGVTGPSSQ